jgi:hypothetical protein
MIAQIVDGLIGEAVELAGLGVSLDLAIQAVGLECLESSAEFRVLVGRQAGDGFLDVFDAHNANVIWDFFGCHGITPAGRRHQPEQPLPQLQKSAADAL